MVLYGTYLHFRILEFPLIIAQLSNFPLNCQGIKTRQEPTCPNTTTLLAVLLWGGFHPCHQGGILFDPFWTALFVAFSTKVPKLREAREDPQHLQLVLLEAEGGAYLLGQELDVRQGWTTAQN